MLSSIYIFSFTKVEEKKEKKDEDSRLYIMKLCVCVASHFIKLFIVWLLPIRRTEEGKKERNKQTNTKSWGFGIRTEHMDILQETLKKSLF